METAFGILSSLVPLLIMGGIVFLIVKAVSKRGSTTGEGVGVTIRRFFQYGVMLAMLVLAAIGVSGIINAATSASNRITTANSETALFIAFVFVALPVFAGLVLYTSRRLRVDPREQASAGWAIYLTVALIGSLVTVMSLAGAFLSEFLDDATANRTVAIYALTWASVWAAHWWVAQRWGYPKRLHAHLIIGSAAGMVTTFVGVAVGTAAVGRQIYDHLFQTSIVDSGIEPLGASLVIVVVGVPVWWWYWFRYGRSLDRGGLWLTYVLLLGVLSGAIAFISGTGVLLYGILEWMIGDPQAASAAAHFDFVPAAFGTMIAGGAIWWYHGTLVGHQGDRERTEVDRVYDYLLSGAGLVVTAIGVSTLLTITLKALAGLGIASFESGNATAAALTLLVIGMPLWWRYWSTIEDHRTSEPDSELHSITRRVYLFVLLGVAGIVSVIDLIIVIFIIFEDILEGDFGAATLDAAAVPVALLLSAGAIAWYHAAVLREDRASTPDETGPVLRRAIVLGSDPSTIARAIRERTGAAVTEVETTSTRSHASSLEEVLEILHAAPDESVAVIERENGTFDVIPIKTED